MKVRTRILSSILALLMCAAMLPFTALSSSAAGASDLLLTQFKAMTFNIKTGNIDSSYENMVQTQQKPDILGLQEVTSSQYTSWNNALTDTPPSNGIRYAAYQGSFRGISGLQTNECNPIFYNPSLFTLKTGGTFWLSDTPNSTSKFSDSEYNRICTWVLLQVTGKSAPAEYVLFMNTHLDAGPNYTNAAGAKQAKVLLQQMVAKEASLKSTYSIGATDVLATVITGDFNFGSTFSIMNYMLGTGNTSINGTNEANTITNKRLSRAISMTANRSYNTFENATITATTYSGTSSAYRYDFDHILATTRSLNCNEYKIVCSIDTQDHLPVISTFQLKLPVDSAKLEILNVDEQDSSFSFYKDGANTPSAYTSLTCAPTSLNTLGAFKFFADSTQTGNLKTYIDKISISNGAVQSGVYTPVATPAGVEGTASTYSEPYTPSFYAGMSSGATSNSKITHTFGAGSVTGTQVQSGARSATFSGGAVRLLNSTTVSGNSGANPAYVNASFNAVGSANTTTAWGNASGATLDMTLKFDNLPRFTGSTLPTSTSATNPVGQIGLIFDFGTRGMGATYDFYIAYIAYPNATLGGDEVLITNLTGNRNSINTSPIEYIHTGILLSEADSYHRYTFSYNKNATGNKLSVYVDGTLKGTSTGIMYRSSALAYESVWVTLSNRGITASNTWVDATMDSYALYNGPFVPPSNLATFASYYTELSQASASAYTPNSINAANAALAALKNDSSVLNDASGYPFSYSTVRITDRTEDIQAAAEGLEPMASGASFTDLFAAIEAADAKKQPMYTPETWTTLQNALAPVNFMETNQAVVDGWTAAINSALAGLAKSAVIWYEDFDNATSTPPTLTDTGYNYATTFLNGFWQYNISSPASGYNGSVKNLAGITSLGDSTGVTLEFYMDIVSLPTLPTEAKAPFRGLQFDAYLAGVDKMVTFSLNAMTAAEKTANPGCDAWICIFNVERNGAIVYLPVDLDIGDGLVHKYTFIYDTSKVKDLTGNIFGIYSDSACTDLVDTINVSAPIASSNDLPIYQNPTDTTSGVRIYYIKQMAAGEGYLLNNTPLVYEMSAGIIDTTVNLNKELLSGAPLYALKGAPTRLDAYKGLCDDNPHNLLTAIANPMPARVSITYSTNGIVFTSTIPSRTAAGEYTFYVKAQDNTMQHSRVYELTATIDYLLSIKLVGNSGTDSVSLAIDDGAPTSYSNSVQNFITVQRGSFAVLTANGANFAYWKNARSGKAISTNPTLTYPVGTKMDLEAIYIAPVVDPSVDYYTVIFRNLVTGKVRKTMEVPENYVITAADLPAASAIYGYQFDEWATRTRESAVGYTVNEQITFLGYYMRSATEPQYTLTIQDGTTETRQLSFAKTISVTSTNPNFAYWTLDGVVMTTKPTIVFGMPDNDATLTAVYNQPIPLDPIVHTVTCKTNSEDALALIYTRDIPADLEFVESGVLLTRKASPSDLYVGTMANVSKGISSATEDLTFYGFTKDLTGKSGTWYIRSYLIYRDMDDNLSYAYSETYQINAVDGIAVNGTLYSA